MTQPLAAPLPSAAAPKPGCSACGRASEASFTEPLAHVLTEIAALLRALTDEQYARKPVGVLPGSIGGHVRHGIDHVRALLGAVATGTLDYDRRERGTPIEVNRRAALEALDHTIGALRTLDAAAGDRAITVRALLSAHAPPVEVRSTLGRELVYVLTHTIHHNATISAMAATLGVAVPSSFGYAPSTTAFLLKSSCVR